VEEAVMASDFIIDVNEADFEYQVVAYSANTPVIVDFWATWCKPCKELSPLLERLARQAGGSFRLARLDVDRNPNLAILYGVRSIPTVKAFSGGQVVGEFVGILSEERLAEFLSQITPPSPLALAVEKASSLLDLKQWTAAEEIFRKVLEQDADQTRSLLGLARTLLAQGKAGEASFVLAHFPASREYAQAELLQPYARALVELDEGRLPADTDLDAVFAGAVRLARRGKFPAALDGLLDILRQDKRYRGGKARAVFLSLLAILGDDDPEARQYRAELASVLF
jgi:putative thioredoxin